MKWKPTPLVKMYEALGAVVDGRNIIDTEAQSLLAQLEKLDLYMLGKKVAPPSGY